MAGGLPTDARRRHSGSWSLDAPRCHSRQRDTPTKGDTMTWTTPTATDFRFGFEITMYVAAR